jgi:hypothetical protein
MRDYDFVSFEHDVLVGMGALEQDLLSGLPTTVVAGLAATQTSPASLGVSLRAGRIYSLQVADAVSVGSIPADSTVIVQQGQSAAQSVVMVPPATGQSQWNLIQCQWSQQDAVRAGDPNGGIVPFYNSTNPTIPLPTSVNTVRQGRLIVQVLTGSSAATGSEVPPTPSTNWTPLYLIDLVGGQTTISTAQILTAGPSVGTGVPSNYPRAPFLAGLLASHHSGALGQAPRINLSTEVSGILPYANMSPVRILLTGTLNLYVSPSGSDANPGTTPGFPFLTIQAAINAVYRNYDFNGNSCAINLANGSYGAGVGASGYIGNFSGLPLGMPAGGLVLIGNTGSPGSVTLIATNANGLSIGNGAYVICQGVTIQASGTANTVFGGQGYGVTVGTGGALQMSNCVIGSCGNAQISVNNFGIFSSNGGGPLTLTGTTPYSLACNGGGGRLFALGSTFTVTGLICTGAFALASECGIIDIFGNTFFGSATGIRYNVTTNGVINTNGGGANFLPGNSAGVFSNGGQYV